MEENLLKIVEKLNEVLWGPILLPLLLGTGLYYTIRLRFVQKKVGRGFKEVFGNAFKKEKADEDGMSSFQALATAIAAQVGTGNLAGVATAIVAGGPGAIFWMWVSGILGMATNYGEAVLGQLYKKKVEGQIVGGPAYYIREGTKSKFLAGFFAVALVLSTFFTGNMVQSNSISETMQKITNLPEIIIGVVLAMIVGFILVGGLTRIASFTEKIVPLMALLYIIGGLLVVIMNFDKVGIVFKSIFTEAFSFKSVGGGIMGVAVMKAVRFGMARGLFSNEAGMGSTPHAHAVAKVKHPGDQGLVALVGVAVDTLIICTLTALVILTTGVLETDAVKEVSSAGITQLSFEMTFGGVGKVFIAVSILFFALSTIIGWYYFGENNIRYLFGEKGVFPYKSVFILVLMFGTVVSGNIIWDLADTFNGIMVFPNLIALLLLSPRVVATLKDYNQKNKI